MIEELYNHLNSRKVSIETLNEKAHKWLKKNNISHSPFGIKNSKLGNIACTYRLVGFTCPATCSQKHICYAKKGHTGMQSRRDEGNRIDAVNAAAAAMLISYIHNKRPARLHVSGDFGQAGVLDFIYLEQIVETAKKVRNLLDFNGIIAYTYTHYPLTTDIIQYMRENGVVVLKSDMIEIGGAIVATANQLKNLKEENKDIKFAKCPAQLSKKASCETCQICPKAYEHEVCVVFKPH